MLEDVELYPTPKFNTCRSCGKARVLKPGDYCRECAIIPDSAVAEDRYIIVEPHTMADTSAKTGVTLSYLKAKYERTQSMKCQYVLFFSHGIWQDVVVDRMFYLPRVMQTLLER